MNWKLTVKHFPHVPHRRVLHSIARLAQTSPGLDTSKPISWRKATNESLLFNSRTDSSFFLFIVQRRSSASTLRYPSKCLYPLSLSWRQQREMVLCDHRIYAECKMMVYSLTRDITSNTTKTGADKDQYERYKTGKEKNTRLADWQRGLSEIRRIRRRFTVK